MKILITGVHGFVGSNLVHYLAPHHRIYALSSSTMPVEGVQEIYTWDNLSSIPQVDVIIHLAAIAHDIDGELPMQPFNDVNVELTRQIFDVFRSSSAHTFIFTSTIAAVAQSSPTPLDEEALPHPVGNYAESKYQAEQYISSFIDSLDKQGKSTYILRPSMIYGKGCKGNLRLLYGFVRRNIPWPLGAFDNQRTFTSVDNICYIIQRLLQDKIGSGIYNVCDDDSLSTNSLVSIMSHALGKSPHLLYIPPSVMINCAKIGDAMQLPFNTKRLSKLTEDFLVSNLKIKKALNIERMPFETKEALTRTIKSFANDNT